MLKAVVQYDGTEFYGFQIQERRPTIQGTLEAVLEIICGEPIRVAGAGRTDRGVHARAQVVSFTTAWSRSRDELQRACNARLPESIAIQSLEVMPDDFHARRSARARTYRYSINNRPARAPLADRQAWHVSPALDAPAMHTALQDYVGRHDFVAFGSPPKKAKRTDREILSARCWRELGWVYVELSANAFLQGMVRRIVGALVEVGAGRLQAAEFEHMLQARDKRLVKWKAPPQGLCLWEVTY